MRHINLCDGTIVIATGTECFFFLNGLSPERKAKKHVTELGSVQSVVDVFVQHGALLPFDCRYFSS